MKNNFNGINFLKEELHMSEDVMEVKSEESSEKNSEERTEEKEDSLEKISVELKSEKLMLK